MLPLFLYVYTCLLNVKFQTFPTRTIDLLSVAYHQNSVSSGSIYLEDGFKNTWRVYFGLTICYNILLCLAKT